MANISSNMLITNETLSQISLELLGEENVSFTFPYLMISDGVYPLENNSGPILNHVYSFPVTEMNRSNNNILLVATIDEDAYLTIRELALYCEFGDGTKHVFSKISGLNVKKGEDLVYNLMIQVKLDLNVVNTIAMPEIVLKEVEYPKFSEFKKVRDVYAYTVENLERMIKTNALGIGEYKTSRMSERKPVGVGYNTAQTYCMLEDKINLWEDNFCSTFDYSNLRSKYKEEEITEIVFDQQNLELFGGASVLNNGDATVISDSNVYVDTSRQALVGDSTSFYVNDSAESFISPDEDFSVLENEEALVNKQLSRMEIKTFDPTDFNRWDFTISFTTKSINEDEVGIINFKGADTLQPLIFGIRSSNCFLEMANQDGEILAQDLFLVEPSTKYYVKVSFSGTVYRVDYAKDGQAFENVLTFRSPKNVGSVSNVVIGAIYNSRLGYYLNPYSGLLHLIDFEANFYNYDSIGTLISKKHYDFRKEYTHFLGKGLKDFYHIPEYMYSYFKVNNLAFDNRNSVLEIFEGYIKGREDQIDFVNLDGFSICVKTFLQDMEDKVIIAKGDVETEDFYFILKQEDGNLVFEYYLGDDVFTMEKEISYEERKKFIANPITLYVTCDGAASPTFKMYKNNELLTSGQASKQTSLKATDYYITNQLNEDINFEEGRRVLDLFSFSGVLEPSDIYYINNLMDTNF